MTASLAGVRGIGPATARMLTEHGIHSVEDLAATHVKQLTAIPGFSDIRAAQVIEDAVQLLTDTDTPGSQPIDKQATGSNSVLKVKKEKTKNKVKNKKDKVDKAEKSAKKVKDKSKGKNKDKNKKKPQKNSKYRSVKEDKKHKTDKEGNSKDKKKKKNKNA